MYDSGKLIDSLGLSNQELDRVINSNSIITLFDSSLKLENIQVKFGEKLETDSYIFINPFQIIENTLELNEIDFNFQGTIVKADASVLNITMQNVTINTESLHQIMSLGTKCSRESSIPATVILKNLIIIDYSGATHNFWNESPMLEFKLAQNIAVENVQIYLQQVDSMQSPYILVAPMNSG